MEQSSITPYSPEWFKARLGVFTASEIFRLMTEPREKKRKDAGMLSIGAETYILEKVHERLTGIPKANVDNYATQWGVEHEPLAAQWYSKLTNNKLYEPFLAFHPSIENFACTPDKLVNEDGLLEIKCPANGSNHLKHCFITKTEYFKDEHPEYYWQAQAQMSVTKRKWCDFVSFDPRINSDLGMFIYKLEAQLLDIELLESKVTKANEMFTEFLRLFSQSYVEETT